MTTNMTETVYDNSTNKADTLSGVNPSMFTMVSPVFGLFDGSADQRLNVQKARFERVLRPTESRESVESNHRPANQTGNGTHCRAGNLSTPPPVECGGDPLINLPNPTQKFHVKMGKDCCHDC